MTSERSQRGALWRSLEELGGEMELTDALRRELPESMARELELAALAHPSRRQVLQVMAASMALGGLAACKPRPLSELVPYSHAPDHSVQPSQPLFFATALLHEGYASPARVESIMGRPIKVEGNPEHPESLGATDIFAQASILRMYDPDRSRTVRRHGRIASWADFAAAWRTELGHLRARRGAGLRILTGRWCSPSFDASLQRLMAELPEARWHRHEPIDPDPARRAARAVLGAELDVQPRLHRARRLLALGSDFLFESPARVRNAREFAQARRVWQHERPDMLRLYAVEPTSTLTGANADHRLAVRAAELPRIARRAAALLGVAAAGEQPPLGDYVERWIAACVDALRAAGPRALVLAGRTAPPDVHALALAMNAALGALGETVVVTRPADRSELGPPGTLGDLAEAMHAGEVRSLAIIGANPVYTAPPAFELGAALRNFRGLAIHAGEYRDETAVLCDWHLPLAHELECWQDARSPEGRVTLIQPLIEPLYRGRPAHMVLALLGGAQLLDDREAVRELWRARGLGGDDFERGWREALLRGWIEGTEAPAVPIEVDAAAVRTLVGEATAVDAGKDELEIVFRPDDTVWDGCYANNGWLQELPKPLTMLTWSNAALLAPQLAARLGLTTGDMVRLRLNGHEVEAPVQVMPGQPDRSVCVALGYGRRRAGRVGNGLGFDAYELRPAHSPWSASGLVLEALGQHFELAHTQHHHRTEGRDQLRTGALEEFRRDPAAIAAPHYIEPGRGPGAADLVSEHSLLPERPYEEGPQWGMSIDLTACIGCGACTIACQAENNIPVVGPDQVRLGRELHWIRVDRYFDGPPHQPGIRFQPVPCMHCEKAPCELVCPVGATQHSHDGLNDMAYNRCVGTRYCSNNCPYKVRRFNFFGYASRETPVRAMQRNPEVTVRSRGVMEKCTYCVQRIRKAEAQAREQDREIRDGEVRTACQEVCPAQAIVFGDISDASTLISRRKALPHDYGMLAELNTQPRTTYLAQILNPDPRLESLERELDDDGGR